MDAGPWTVSEHGMKLSEELLEFHMAIIREGGRAKWFASEGGLEKTSRLEMWDVAHALDEAVMALSWIIEREAEHEKART